MQNKGMIVPPPGHDGNISLHITLLICHYNGCSHCSHCVLFVCMRWKCVCVCDNVYMVESVGVDSSVLIHSLGYTEDIVDYWVWHCTTSLLSISSSGGTPQAWAWPQKALCKTECGIAIPFSIANHPIFLRVSLVIRASSRCEGNAANWNVLMHKTRCLM